MVSKPENAMPKIAAVLLTHHGAAVGRPVVSVGDLVAVRALVPPADGPLVAHEAPHVHVRLQETQTPIMYAAQTLNKPGGAKR